MERTYKLIKEYPTSRNLGFECTADDSHGFIPNPLNWIEVIKLDVPIGTVFFSQNYLVTYTIDSIDSDGKVKISWGDNSRPYSVEEVNEYFRNGTWKVYEEPTKLDVPIGKKFKHKDAPTLYLLDSINKDDNTVSVTWYEDNKLCFLDYPIEKINIYFKNGVWVLHEETIKLDVPIGTKFSDSSKIVYTIDSIHSNDLVKITSENGIILHFPIKNVNARFKNGVWKVYIEPIKLDVAIGTVFTCENDIHTIDSIDSDNKVKVTWSNCSFIHTIEQVNQFFKDGSWKVYKKKPTKLDVPIGTKFIDSRIVYTIDSISSDYIVKITDGLVSYHCSIITANNYFKNGSWKVYEEPIKLDVPIGTKFTTSSLDKTIYTIDSIDSDNKVIISRVGYSNGYSFESVNDFFKKGVWKVYIEPIKLDVPIGTVFTLSGDDDKYTIDSINLDNVVKVIWEGFETVSKNYNIISVNDFFKKGVWKVYIEPIKLDVPIGTKFRKFSNYTYTIDSINSDNVVKVIWEGFETVSICYDIISVNYFFKKGIWKVYNEPNYLFKTEDGIHKYLGDSYIKLEIKGFNIIRVDGYGEPIMHDKYIYFDDIVNLYEYAKLNEVKYSLNDLYKLIGGFK